VEHGHGTHGAKKQAGEKAKVPDLQEERDLIKLETSLNSYMGETDTEKADNRTWFHETYLMAWPCMPEVEDREGKAKMIEQSL